MVSALTSRCVVVVPTGFTPRLESGPRHQVVCEEDLVKCHSITEVANRARQRHPPQWVTLSPVAPTQTKPGYGPALGPQGIRGAVELAPGLPIVALGGVTPANARAFLAAGAAGIAICGPIVRAQDPQAVLNAYLAVLE